MIKIKDDKGITLVILIIFIIIIGLFAGTITYNGITLLRQSQKTAFLQELQIIQEKVNIIYEKIKTGDIIYDENYLRDCVLGLNGNLDNIPSEKTSSNHSDFRKLDSKEDFTLIGLDDIQRTYYINFKTAEVISEYGFEDGDTIYYNLEDFGFTQSINKSTYINSRIEKNSSREYEIKVSISYPENYICKYSINDEYNYENYEGEFQVDNGSTIYTKISEDGVNYIESDSRTIMYERFTTYGIHNAPQISNGMQPVRWDENANEGNGEWVEVSENDSNWYSYTGLTPTYAHIKLKDGSIFAWIPRFSNTDKNIIYSNGRIDYTDNSYSVNSAFNINNKKLLGIWVAVYPASENKEYNLIQSIEQSEYITIENLSEKCEYIREYTGIYGIYPNDVDTFLINNNIYNIIKLMPGNSYQIQSLPDTYSADRPIIIL